VFEPTSDVPIPDQSVKRGRGPIYPWKTMEIGDSFFIEGKTSTYGATLAHQRKHTGHRYTCRTVDGGVRIWRIA
jgi:hypothetical protein